MFCLMPAQVDQFIVALRNGKINPEKLADMSSAERNKFLAGIVGEGNAQSVNSLFESKLLLKNQQRGMVTWAKQVSNITPAARRDMIKKIENMQKVLDPGEQKDFMRDLTATRLGTNVTREEAKQIADLSKKVTEAEAKRNKDKTFATNDERMAYGRAVEDLTQYVADLKKEADKIRISDFKTPLPTLGRAANKVAGNLKSLTASMDNSSIFRQGWKTFITNPKIWRKNAANTFINGAKVFGGKNVMREVNADIISRPTYDKMVRAKLAIKNPEEAFPESWAEKVPVYRRLYNASQDAYTAFVYQTRADVFDKYLQIAEKSGVDIGNKKELEAIGKLVNSLTGRGDVGALEPVANVLNNVFFSPRFLKSNIDTLTVHALDKNITPFARKQAAKNLLKIISATSAILATADAVLPGSVEWDPRSSDFGKIRVKDTRFDVTGGMGSLAVLAARLARQESKSASTGKVTKIDSGDIGAKSTTDTVNDFFMNKVSPAVGLAIKLREGRDSMGREISPGKAIAGATIPIGIQNVAENYSNPNSANPLAAYIADALGISASTYSPSEESWENSKSKELTSFKAAVGPDKFKAASKEFDKQYNEWIAKTLKDSRYKALSSDEKAGLITSKKSKIKKEIFKSNGFKYKAQKKDSNKELL